MNRFAFSLFLFSLLSSRISAQKAEKGSSPDNPWNKEIRTGINMELNYSSPSLPFKYSLSFGDWKFESKFMSSVVVKSEIHNADPGIFVKSLSQLPYNHRNAIKFFNDSIHVNGIAPGAIPYGFYFTYADSLIEQYDQVFLSYQHYGIFHFYKTVQGKVQHSAGDLSPFYISVIFADTILQTNSYILAGTDTISLKAISNPEDVSVYKSKELRNSYAGFDFYKNDTLVGAAHRKYNFVGEPIYLYWFNPQLDLQHQEAIAAMIFLIAGFIK